MTREWVRPLWFLFTVGWYVALSVVIPAGIGYWLDQGVFGTNTLYTLIGLGFGTVIAFVGLVRMLRRFKAETNSQNTKEDAPPK